MLKNENRVDCALRAGLTLQHTKDVSRRGNPDLNKAMAQGFVEARFNRKPIHWPGDIRKVHCRSIYGEAGACTCVKANAAYTVDLSDIKIPAHFSLGSFTGKAPLGFITYFIGGEQQRQTLRVDLDKGIVFPVDLALVPHRFSAGLRGILPGVLERISLALRAHQF